MRTVAPVSSPRNRPCDFLNSVLALDEIRYYLLFVPNTNSVATLPCNTALDCARLAFIRGARTIGEEHGVLGGARHELTAALAAGDLEMCLAISTSVVAALLVASERETADRRGRSASAGYVNLLMLGRAAMVIPS